jgi:sugar/nucleoside kinase (ribokinase family)
MNITVIGHLCLDNVHLPGEETPRQSYGGIVFTIATLANLMGPDDTITPVFGVGEADHGKFMEWLSQYPCVSHKGIFARQGPTNEVHLFYDGSTTGRIECSKHIAPPIPFEAIRPFLSCDGILVNMISGSDITLETLDKIRMEVRDKGTPIHFDFHSLTLGIDKEHKRFRRPLSDWRRWCFMLHSVQMSDLEASGLTAERCNEEQLINQLMPLMVTSLIITRGAQGATLIHQQHKKLSRHDEPGIPVDGPADPTGCGDVFGAGFFYRLLKSRNVIDAVKFANRAAAAKVPFTGAEGLHILQEQL